MLQDAGEMFDRYGVVLLLCITASAFAGIICLIRLRSAVLDRLGRYMFVALDALW
jgi:hypothetical protein